MTLDEHTGADAAVVRDLAIRAGEPKVIVPGSPVVMLDAQGEPIVLSADEFLPTPRRKAGVYRPATVDALAEYVSSHHCEGTTIWIDKTQDQITAVLNDHPEDGTGWRDHLAILKLLKTPEWQHWTGKDGQYFTPMEFAEHLQDGIEEIRRPDAATMLEIAESIRGRTKAEWKSAQRLHNGEVQFAYQEEVEASAGRSGQLEIPQEFDLAVSPFYGEEPAAISARLRYRVREGQLSIGYKLMRPHDVVQGVLSAIESRLRDTDGFSHVYLGAPPA